MSLNWKYLTATFTLLACPLLASAQPERFEIGVRLRALEKAWDEFPEAAGRRRAAPHLKKAVATFFALQPGEAGRSLDLARFALQSETAPATANQWAESLYVRPESRFVDPADGTLAVTLASFYKVEAEQPAKARVRFTLTDAAGKKLAGPVEGDIASLPVELKLPITDVFEGDHSLRAEILVGDKVLVSREIGIACASKRNARLAALRKEIDSLPRETNGTDRQTAFALARLLDNLAQKQALETNYPAARLLSEAEAVSTAMTIGKTWYGQKRTGQFWLTLALGKTTLPVRLLAPKAATHGEPLPLVIALHGAGGSENLFFDGYGVGATVRACEERGWLLVAPRCPLVTGSMPIADLIDEVNRLYPVDQKRVFVIGHSMGASLAVTAAGATPERYTAVAALGGGGSVKPSEGLKAVPFFVGVGSEDFALGWAKNLKSGLEKAGVQKLEFHEYPDIEHLAIVQVALKDVLAFFERSGAK